MNALINLGQVLGPCLAGLELENEDTIIRTLTVFADLCMLLKHGLKNDDCIQLMRDLVTEYGLTLLCQSAERKRGMTFLPKHHPCHRTSKSIIAHNARPQV
jgi:hypothetical protein